MQTAADHEATLAARTEELKVIAEAKKILMDTSGGAVDQSYSMLQLRMKLRTRADLKNNEVVAVVKNLAEKHHSAALSQLASRIAAVVRMGGANGGDVFAKIKGLITDLIAKLESEADADAEEKAYCDEQMAKTEAKQTELEDDVEKLSTKIDQASSKSAELKEEVTELQAELAALAKEQAEMDKIRKDQNAAYTKAKAELELGLSGVRKALTVLQDYYGAALLQNGQELTGFMQQPKVPTHSKSTGAGQSIISILQVCESDFAKDLAAEETEESDSQSEYDAQTQENTVTKTTKDQDVKYKTQEYKGLDKSIAELTADRANEQSELDAVNEYYAKVKDRCVAKPESYEERKKRREAEIAGLKEALSVLDNETAFVQGRKHGHLRSHLITRQ
jgi:chromosome segregation ATPase